MPCAYSDTKYWLYSVPDWTKMSGGQEEAVMDSVWLSISLTWNLRYWNKIIYSTLSGSNSAEEPDDN